MYLLNRTRVPISRALSIIPQRLSTVSTFQPTSFRSFRAFSEQVVKHDNFIFQKLTPDPENTKKIPIPKDAFAPGMTVEPSQGQTDIVRSPMRDEDDFYDETDPLHADMLEISSHVHDATLIWLLGAGDAHEKSRPIYEVLSSGLPGFRVVVPNPPRIPITALNDRMERAWYDIEKPQYSDDVDDYDDFKGMTKSTRRLHELIHEEIQKLSESLEASSEPLPSWCHSRKEQAASRIFLGGFAQGGALALYSGIRFPQTLGGLISFSGYFPFLTPTIAMANRHLANATSTATTTNQANPASLTDTQSADAATTPASSISSTQAASNSGLRAAGLDAPVLVIHGKEDEAIPYRFAISRYAKALKPPLGMSIRLIEDRNLGHHVGPQQMDAMRQWLLGKLKHNKELAPLKPKRT